jgi:signal transduction histidine kinase
VAVSVEHRVSDASGRSAQRLARLAFLPLAPLAVAAAVVGAVDGWDGGVGDRSAWVGLTLAWGAAGLALLLRRGDERLGQLALWFCLLAGAVALAGAIARDRPGGDAAALIFALAVALLPAAGMHVLLALPVGALATRPLQLIVATGYVIAAGVAVLIWTVWPSSPAWPVALETAVAAGVGGNGLIARYRLSRGEERRRMNSVALAVTVATELVLAALILHVFAGWPSHMLQIAAIAAMPIPLALLLERSERLQGSADSLLAHAISLVGLTALVAAVYLVVVLGLGHAPTDKQRTLIVLSLAAAGISAILYVPARSWLTDFANGLVHGRRQAPDEIVRSFGTRLSRAVPLEELLLQLAESLRSALALDAVEVWTGWGGILERVVSEPDRGHASLRLTASEESVVARAGVSGPAWIAVWLPQLTVRVDVLVRVAPITHAGELFGILVAERSAEAEPFGEDEEHALRDLARQVALALRNVRLDSELQASLDELRRHADELRASRARVVAAADAERRRIERDLHDGAQQHLVGLAVNLRVAQELVDPDPVKAKAILDELRQSIQGAMQELRELSHGIYPPLLQDRGLTEALANAARRAAMPTRIEARALRRYDPGVEATVYFCCLEALQNATKYAGEGARAKVRIWEEEGGLLFEVADDGSGLDFARGGVGTGLTNMRDRLGAIGGSLRIESAPGRGTRVIGAIPLEL